MISHVHFLAHTPTLLFYEENNLAISQKKEEKEVMVVLNRAKL
jgi:hypothetical protein